MKFCVWLHISWTLLSINDAQHTPKNIGIIPYRNYLTSSQESGNTISYCEFQDDVKYCFWYRYDKNPDDYEVIVNNGSKKTCQIRSSRLYSCTGIQQLSTTEVNIGDRLTLPCSSSYKNNCQWMVNNNFWKITVDNPGKHQKMSYSNDCSLSIDYISHWNVGFYTCIKSNTKSIMALYYLSLNFKANEEKSRPIANVTGLIVGLCVSCLAIVVLILVVVYLYKSQRKQLSAVQRKTSSRHTPTNTVGVNLAANSNSTYGNIVNPASVSAPNQPRSQHSHHNVTTPKSANSTSTGNNNDQDQIVYSSLTFSTGELTANRAPQRNSESVDYATIVY